MARKLLLILRFYYSTMFYFCTAVSIGFAWVVKNHGPATIPWCMLGKAMIYPLYLYVWILRATATNFSTTATWASGAARCWASVALWILSGVTCC